MEDHHRQLLSAGNPSCTKLSDRKKESEREFFDNNKGYTARRRLVGRLLDGYTCWEELFKAAGDIRDKTVLDLGCGEGYLSRLLAIKGAAKVVGIDISSERIKLAAMLAKNEDLKNVEHVCCDAEHIPMQDKSFDIVLGTAILHHLDIEKTLKEIHRVLKPTGRAVFAEPLGHNIFINLFRMFTPKLRTKDEHPIVRQDIVNANRYFKVDFIPLHLISMVFIPFNLIMPRSTRLFMLRCLFAIDRGIFRLLPASRFHARYGVIWFEKQV